MNSAFLKISDEPRLSGLARRESSDSEGSTNPLISVLSFDTNSPVAGELIRSLTTVAHLVNNKTSQTDLTVRITFHCSEGEPGPARLSVGDVGAVVAAAVFVVDDQQDDAQEETDGANGDVGDAQERVLASHPGDGAQDHPLPALKAAHGIIWVRLLRDETDQWEVRVTDTTSSLKSFKKLLEVHG